jgi:chromosome segregation ATPase
MEKPTMNLLNHLSRIREELATDPAAQHPSHQGFAEEAARAAQRYFDQIATIEQLTNELDGWRNRAVLAEAEIQRLEKRLDDLQSVSDHRISKLSAERDKLQQAIAVLAAQFTSASKIILDGFRIIDGLELQARIPTPALAAMADNDPPFPSFVAKGPAAHDDRDN